MQIANKPAFDPRRALLVVKPAPKPVAEKPVAEKPTEVPRYVEQQAAAKSMLSRLATDAKLAAIMLNPVFAPHANAIAWAATGRAIARYETEVPRQELGALMNDEQSKARKEILGLPKRYAEATGQAIQVTGQAIEDGAIATGNAIVTGATATGNAIATGAKAVGQGIFMGVAAVAGGLFMGGKMLLKGFGAGLSGLGGLLQKAGSSVENAGQ